MRLYYLIDRVPELPYFIFALIFVLYTPVEVAKQVFAVSCLFMVSGIIVGVSLKVLLKTKRPCEYHCIPYVKYDVPSLHTLLSIGAIAYICFINVKYCVFAIPMGYTYMISRLRLGLHTKKAVYVGAAVGLLMGSLFGYLLWRIDFHGFEYPMSVLFFLIPVSATLFRLKYLGHNKI